MDFPLWASIPSHPAFSRLIRGNNMSSAFYSEGTIRQNGKLLEAKTKWQIHSLTKHFWGLIHYVEEHILHQWDFMVGRTTFMLWKKHKQPIECLTAHCLLWTWLVSKKLLPLFSVCAFTVTCKFFCWSGICWLFKSLWSLSESWSHTKHSFIKCYSFNYTASHTSKHSCSPSRRSEDVPSCSWRSNVCRV